MSDFLNPHLTRPAVRWTSGDALPAVEQTGPAAPLLVDASTGRLLVDTEANLSADLSAIESKMDTANGIATTTAADLAAVKTQLATGTIAVTGGGGGGGSGASAAYNATLPTYTSGASTTLQTDVNGRLITTNANLVNLDADLGNVADAVATSDTGSFSLIALTKRLLGKFSALTDGTQVATVNNAALTAYNFSQTGVIAINTVLIGPIDCSQTREITMQVTSVGAGMSIQGQYSLDGTNWRPCWYFADSTTGAIGSSTITATNGVTYFLGAAKFFRLIAGNNQSSGTTTLVAYASQQATPKLYQSITGAVSLSGVNTIIPVPNSNTGFASYHTLISAASTNATLVKNSGGALGTCVLTNTSSSWRFVKFYNSSNAPNVGTSTPLIQFPIAPNSSLDVSMSFAGFRLALGIAYSITSGSALLDATAVGAGEVLVNLSYI